jgi:hypothetical protein
MAAPPEGAGGHVDGNLDAPLPPPPPNPPPPTPWLPYRKVAVPMLPVP